MINNKYIELLQQYRSGTISDSDRHILERAALDDPFLFDAMEGYAIYGSNDDQKALTELAVTKNKEKSKVRWLNNRLLGVAASLIALIAITFVVKNQLSSNSSQPTKAIAQNKSSNDNTPIAQDIYAETSEPNEVVSLESSDEGISEEEDMEFVSINIGDVNSDAKEMETPISTSASSSTAKEMSKDLNEDLNFDIAEEKLESTAASNKDEIEQEVKATNDVILEAPIAVESKAAPTLENESRSKKKMAKPAEDAITYDSVEDESQYILGKVLNTDGTELIGVNVHIENTEIGDISDIEGNFKLPKYERGHQIVISYTGYEDQKIIIGDQNFYQVVLRQLENLSEVKVTRLQVVDKYKAYPAMGIEEFEIFVKDNMKFPLEVFGAAKTKKMKVSFDVDMSGNLSNFVDESKDCDDCFKEAVRLLNESGRWETKPFGSAYRTSYTFEF